MKPVEEISAAEAHARLGELRVVDVREPHEFRGPLGHVAGAMLQPLGLLDLNADAIPDDRTLLAVCRSGKRSEQACRVLAGHGRRVLNLAGGMIAWNRAGLPVERHEPATLAELRDSVTAWFAQLAGRDAGTARATLDAFLAEAGASFDAPTAAALDHAIERLAGVLAEGGAPPDLDLGCDAFRRALAVL